MPNRIALITIGQTPRSDLVPELLSWVPREIEAVEMGALDGMSAADIARLRPTPGEEPLVTRMSDGAQVVLSKDWVQSKLREMLRTVDRDAYRAVVLLCTGTFSDLHTGGLLLDAQHIVDHGAEGIAHGARRMGIVLPLHEQAESLRYPQRAGRTIVTTYASPYTGNRFAEAGAELSDAEIILMHCMGYTEAQRRILAETSGRPVLLARRLVAAALAQLV